MSTSTASPAAVQSVEEYRRYPRPELLQLSVRRDAAHPLTIHSSASTPVEPAAPRNRSEVESDSASAHSSNDAAAARVPSSSSSSSFTEAMPDDTDRDGSEGESVSGGESNKRGDYRTAPLDVHDATSTPPPQLPLTSAPPAAAAASTDAAAGARSAAEGSTLQNEDRTHTQASSITLRLRWGFQASDLRRVYEMHEDAFPLSYGPSYYDWLLNRDACMALVATVTVDTYKRCVEEAAADGATEEAEEAGGRGHGPLAWFPGYTPTAEEAAAGPPPVPPPASRQTPTADNLQERVLIDTRLTELEYVEERRREERRKERQSRAEKGEEEEEEEAYTEVVGFILGQCAYARDDDGHLLTNPTTYIGSFVVDPRLRRCGLGSALLERFITYVTQQRPLYAQDYLHYDERKLIAMLAQAQLQKRNALAAARGDGSRHKKNDDVDVPEGSAQPPGGTGGTLAEREGQPAAGGGLMTLAQQLITACVPDAAVWWEDHQARQQLRAQGLSEDEIDAQRFRDRLAPDDLTDEEADEVRREARGFLVQTGMREVWLHCLPGNAQANKLYAQRGFTLHRVLRGYYDISGAAYDANLLFFRATPGEAGEGAGMDQVVRRHSEGVRSAAEASMVDSNERDGHVGGKADSCTGPGSETGMRHRHPAANVEASALAQPAPPTGGSPSSTSKSAGAPRRPPASSSSSSWLAESSYSKVADIILCTAAEGQEEWQRRFGRSGGAASRRSPWETVREGLLVVNALGLLCAVLWLAYNVWLTGKVE